MAALMFILAVAALAVVAAAGPRYAAGGEGGAPWRHPTVDEPPAASLRSDVAAVLGRLTTGRLAR